MASDPGKHLRAFDPHRLERVRVEAEQTEDRRRDLGRLNRDLERAGVDHAGRVDDDRHVAICRVGTAVLDALAV